MSDAFVLSSSITIDTSKLNKGLKEAENGFKKVKSSADESEKSGGKFSKAMSALGVNAKSVGDKVSSLAKGITTGVVGALGYATAGSQELRADMSKLQTVAETTGHNFDDVNKQFMNFVAVTGETDSSIEALNNLMNTSGMSAENLGIAVDYLSGAVEMFPDTLNIEGLADSLQESVATGQATGMLAELIGRLGINTEEWNKDLETACSKGQGLNFVMDTLANTGLSNVNSKWQENNKELINSRKATLEFQQSMSQLGTTILPYVTKLVEGITKLVNWVNSLSPAGKLVLAVAIGFIAILPTIITLVGALATVSTALNIAMLPIVAVILAITAVIVGVIATGYLLVTNWDSICKSVGDFWKRLCDDLSAKWDTFKQGVLLAINKLKQDWNAFVYVIKAVWDTVCDGIKWTWDKIVGGIKAAWNTIVAPFKWVADKISAIWNSIKDKFKLPHFKLEGEFSLKKMTVPHVAVDWYYNGGIFNKPTVLGGGIGVGDNYNGTGNQTEVVAPLSDLRDMIKDLLQIDLSLTTNGKVLMREVIAPHIDELDRQLRLRR